jgi:hypothetical protein
MKVTEIYRMHQEHPQDPFRHWHGRLRGWQPMHVKEPDQIEMIRQFNMRQCKKVMTMPDATDHVCTSAARRLCKLRGDKRQPTLWRLRTVVQRERNKR